MDMRCIYHHREAIAVCHHCGAPLCGWIVDLSPPSYKIDNNSSTEQLSLAGCGYLIPDDWFYWPRGKLRPRAYHCANCLEQSHPEALLKLAQHKGATP